MSAASTTAPAAFATSSCAPGASGAALQTEELHDQPAIVQQLDPVRPR
jgi:hypothetical protein